MYGCQPGYDVEQADAEQAYVQADLGGTETWIMLPERRWPQGWNGISKPVVRL